MLDRDILLTLIQLSPWENYDGVPCRDQGLETRPGTGVPHTPLPALDTQFG